MSEYTLYCFEKSGNAYKVALMLNLSEADWNPRFVDYFNGETDSEAFKQLNAMGEVPLLVHNEQVLSQSGVILDYLTEKLVTIATGSKRPTVVAQLM
jgi:glutathione S-transferase